jgi:hypothetical protein
MAKKIIGIAFLVSLLIIAGCGGDPQDPSNNGPSLLVNVQPTDSGTFVANGVFLDSTGDQVVNITVNGTAVTSTYTTITGLSAGTTFDIIASNSKIGTIKKTVTIPAKVTNLQADNLEAWVKRSVPTLTLTWDEGNAEYYFINGNSGANLPWRRSPATINQTDSIGILAGNIDSISLVVQGVNITYLTGLGLFPGSKFEVQGPKSDPLQYP